MVIDFAKINVKEQPVLILQNLDDTPIGVLKYAFNVEADLCYNEISTLTFDLPAYEWQRLYAQCCAARNEFAWYYRNG